MDTYISEPQSLSKAEVSAHNDNIVILNTLQWFATPNTAHIEVRSYVRWIDAEPVGSWQAVTIGVTRKR